MDACTEIISIAQEWEKKLERDYGANGRGLHGKITSIEERLPHPAPDFLRVVAEIRNKAKDRMDKGDRRGADAYAKRELKETRKVDRKLKSIFRSYEARRPRFPSRSSRYANNAQNASHNDVGVQKNSIKNEFLFWLIVAAIVGAYCFWRFH